MHENHKAWHTRWHTTACGDVVSSVNVPRGVLNCLFGPWDFSKHATKGKVWHQDWQHLAAVLNATQEDPAVTCSNYMTWDRKNYIGEFLC